MNASLAEGAVRLHQRRLMGLLLGGPFLVAATVSVLFPPDLGVSFTLAAVCAAFGAGWLSALLLAATGMGRLAEGLALFSGTVALAATVAAAGGTASPASLMLAALPFEAWWLRRSGHAAMTGSVAGLAVIPLQVLLGQFFPSAAASAAHWLIPLAYAGLVAPRLASIHDEMRSRAADRNGEAVENLIDAVVLRMAENGDVTDASARARDILGVTPELLLFNGFFDRVHVSDRVGYLCALADLRHGAACRRVEARLRLPASRTGGLATGDYHPFAIDIARTAGARTILATVRANDEVVALRQAAAKSAEAAESVEIAKSRFLASVSHELRTPLNAIIGFSDMLLHEMVGAFKDERQKEYVGLVRESGHHLLAVVNSILDVSRIEAGAYAAIPEPFRFRDAVDMCHAMLKHQAQSKKLGFDLHVPTEVGEILADRRAVQQILINLVSNAIKFTPEGGEVTIGAKRIGSRVHFWVSDTGIGMSAEDLSRIGKPFTQVQNDYTRQFEGTGLGLSLVKGLVALHEGTMAIESEPGGGTTVTISLPADGPTKGKLGEPGAIVTLATGRPNEDDDATFRKTA